MRDKLIELIKSRQDPCASGDCPFENDDVSPCGMCVEESLADHLIAHGVTLAEDTSVLYKWIPVSERLPDKDGEYFIARNSRFFQGDRYVQTCYFALNLEEVDDYDFYGQERPGWYKYDSEYEHYEIAPVHYWMPLPEAPKEVE